MKDFLKTKLKAKIFHLRCHRTYNIISLSVASGDQISERKGVTITILTNIKPRNAEAFTAKRLASGLAVASVNKDIRTLKQIFSLAIEPRNYLAEGQNPFAKIKQRKKSLNPIRYVSVSEYHALLDATDNIMWKALRTYNIFRTLKS